MGGKDFAQSESIGEKIKILETDDSAREAAPSNTEKLVYAYFNSKFLRG